MSTSARGRAATKHPAGKDTSGEAGPVPASTAITPRHQELVDAAATIFHSKGYNGSSIQDIADLLGILKGSIYYYVKSKDDLLFAVINEIHASALANMADLPGLDGDPLTKIRIFVRRHVIHSVDNIERATVFFRDFSALPQARQDQVLEDRDAYTSILSALIKEARAAGQILPDTNVQLAVLAILGMTNWVYQWYRPSGLYSPDEIADTFARYTTDILTTQH